MKKIAYISRVWGSLEDSYAGYLKKCPDLSRIDYLKLLVSYNPDNSGAVFLPLFLSDELGEYTEEELKEYDGLVEVMNRVHDALGKVTEIDNLQEFVYGAFIKEDDNNVPDIKDFEFFTKGEYCTAMQLLKTGNFANSVVAGAVNKAYVLNPSINIFDDEELQKVLDIFISSLLPHKNFEDIVNMFYRIQNDNNERIYK